MIALLLLENWILMIEDVYVTIDSRHVRLPAQTNSDGDQQLKCDLMHLVNVVSYFNGIKYEQILFLLLLKMNYVNHPKLFVFDFVDESETKEFRWKLEALSMKVKQNFLLKFAILIRNLWLFHCLKHSYVQSFLLFSFSTFILFRK